MTTKITYDPNGLEFYKSGDTITSSNCKLKIDSNGNIGINTTSPNHKLDINGDIDLTNMSEIYSEGFRTLGEWSENDTLIYTSHKVGIGTNDVTDNLVINGNIRIRNTNTGNNKKSSFHYYKNRENKLYIDDDHHSYFSELYRIKHNGYVSNNSSYDKFPLNVRVDNYYSGYDDYKYWYNSSVGEGSTSYNADSWANSSYGRFIHADNNNSTSIQLNLGTLTVTDEQYLDSAAALEHTKNSISIWCQFGVWSGSINFVSDERIKTEIVDFDDNYALDLVNKISSYEYYYKDKLNLQSHKTVGFIAQDVKEHYPIAVEEKAEFIPDKQLFAEGIIWEETSDNKYLLSITNYEVEVGTVVKFYCSNNYNSDEEIIEEEYITKKREDNKYLFNQKYETIFIYGKLIYDLNILDKNNIFVLHHPAIQELDRRQKQDKETIKVLEDNAIK